MYESSYKVDPGNDTRAIDRLSVPCPSSPSHATAFEEPFVYGREWPLVLDGVPPHPLDLAVADDGPASGGESSCTEKAESLSDSVGLITPRSVIKSEDEYSGSNDRPIAESEVAVDEVWLSILCLLRTRLRSESGSEW